MRPSFRLSALPPTLRALLADPPLSTSLTVNGWLKSVRAHKNVAFGEVSDGSGGGLQAVWKGKGRADGLTAGTSVQLKGRLEKSKGGGQAVELVVDETSVLGECDPETYPIQKKHLPAAFLRDHAHLRFRTAQTAAIMRVKDGLMRDWHDWFEANEFTFIHTPILTSSDCEGAGEVFSLAPIYSDHPSSSTSSSSTTSSSSSTPSSSRDSDPNPTEDASTPSPASSPAAKGKDTFWPHPVNLTVSSQLHLETPTLALSRAYTLSPSFRAEPSLTSRHLSEFYMLEAEVAFTRTLDELLDVVEDGIRAVLKRLMWEQGVRAERNRSDLELIAQHQSEGDGEGHLVEARGSSGSDTDTVDNGDRESTGSGTDFEIRGERPPLVHILNAANRPFKRISYTDAITLLSSAHEEEQSFVHTPTWGEGLSTEHEKWLASHFAGPVFVTHYPRKLKPFYMLPSDADPSYDQPTPPTPPTSKETETVTETETVACFDLLFPGIGEMAGGSLREYRVDQLESAMETAGLDKEAYEWYLDLRRFGSVPHGGWGMGWDRWVCWVTGVGNVRDVVPFPRWKGHCKY